MRTPVPGCLARPARCRGPRTTRDGTTRPNPDDVLATGVVGPDRIVGCQDAAGAQISCRHGNGSAGAKVSTRSIPASVCPAAEQPAAATAAGRCRRAFVALVAAKVVVNWHRTPNREDDNAVGYSCRNGAKMSDQLAGATPSEFARPWDSLRRLREPAAWTLIAIAAIIVLVSACQLFNLAGATIPVARPTAVTSSAPAGPPVPVGSTPPPAAAGSGSAAAPAGSGSAATPAGSGPAPVSDFSLRASAVAPQFSDSAVQALPVLAVILVTFCGGMAVRARRVVPAAAAVLAAAFVLSLISLAGAAAAHLRPGTWFVLEAAGPAITAAALVFTGAVLWSRPFRWLAPRRHDFADDEDDGFAEDPDYGGH